MPRDPGDGGLGGGALKGERREVDGCEGEAGERRSMGCVWALSRGINFHTMYAVLRQSPSSKPNSKPHSSSHGTNS